MVLETAEHTPYDSGLMRLTAVSSVHGLTAQGGGCDTIHKATWVIFGEREQWAGFLLSRMSCPLGPTGPHKQAGLFGCSLGCWNQAGEGRHCAHSLDGKGFLARGTSSGKAEFGPGDLILAFGILSVVPEVRQHIILGLSVRP